MEPDREYHYQFRYRRAVSAVGRTRTLPAARSCPAELRFAFVSCQDFASGYYPSYVDIAAQDLGFVLHLGDYVYEGDVDDPAAGTATHPSPNPPEPRPGPWSSGATATRSTRATRSCRPPTPGTRSS